MAKKQAARKRAPKKPAPRQAASLNPRQERFVAEYLIDLNATQAAIRAGYAAKTAEVQGPRLLGNVRVASEIQKAIDARAARTQITQDRVLDELAALAFSNVTHYVIGDAGTVDLAEGAPDYAIRAVSSIKRRTIPQKLGDPIIEVELKLWDKPGAVKLAGQHVGLFPGKVEVTGKNGGPIQTQPVIYLPDNGRPDQPGASDA